MVPEELEAGGVRLPVHVAEAPRRAQRGRSTTRRTARTARAARATLGPNGLSIRLPPSVDAAERERQVAHLLRWARRAVSRDPERFRLRPPRHYRDGDALVAAGRRFCLEVSHADRRTGAAELVGDRLRLVLPAADGAGERRHRAGLLVSGVLAGELEGHLLELCARLHREHFADVAAPKRVRFRFTTRRWGSCSASGHLSISTRLLLAPPRMLEYVCVHELAHLVHLDHSPRFWRRVAAASPAFRESERWLQRHAYDCQF